jgi:hypothetical protein
MMKFTRPRTPDTRAPAAVATCVCHPPPRRDHGATADPQAVPAPSPLGYRPAPRRQRQARPPRPPPAPTSRAARSSQAPKPPLGSNATARQHQGRRRRALTLPDPARSITALRTRRRSTAVSSAALRARAWAGRCTLVRRVTRSRTLVTSRAGRDEVPAYADHLDGAAPSRPPALQSASLHPRAARVCDKRRSRRLQRQARHGDREAKSTRAGESRGKEDHERQGLAGLRWPTGRPSYPACRQAEIPLTKPLA